MSDMINPELAAVAAKMNAEWASQSSMVVGCRIRHPDGYIVKVTSGQYLSNGRVSNWWTWKRVGPKGKLGPEEQGYGW